VIDITDNLMQMKYLEIFFVCNNDTFNNISNIYVTFILIKRNYLELQLSSQSGIWGKLILNNDVLTKTIETTTETIHSCACDVCGSSDNSNFWK
jgi:hypothetical protein